MLHHEREPMGLRRALSGLLLLALSVSAQSVDSTVADAPAAADTTGVAAGVDTSTSADSIETVGSGPADAAVEAAVQADAGTVRAVPKLDERQRVQIRSSVRKKRQAIIAGGALLAGGALIDYGLVYPAAEELDAFDIEGQLALISPQLLAFGLRSAGPSMAAMRTSEVADVYKRNAGVPAPRNWSWWLYYGGWGFYVASFACETIGAMDSSISWHNWGTAMSITSDIVRAATCVYAWLYLRRIGMSVESVAVEPPRVSLVPAVSGSGAAGAALTVRFGSR